MLYTVQYDVRWVAQSLRYEGKLKPVNNRRDLPWELLKTKYFIKILILIVINLTTSAFL